MQQNFTNTEGVGFLWSDCIFV